MALDKIKDITMTTCEKVKASAEITLLKSKIAKENKSINGKYIAIGEYFYNKIKNGEEIPEELVNLIIGIDDHKMNIKEMQLQIDTLRYK